jgi:hypothetical protein
MNRRSFLKNALSTLVAIPVMGTIPFLVQQATRHRTQEEIDCCIARALDTKEGRELLYKSMTEPIRTKLEYKAIGNKFLMSEECKSSMTEPIRTNFKLC